MVTALRQFLGSNALMSYLVMMAPRLVELRRVLKPTGSIYLHCDPTASHYLKLLMDAVFGSERFLNEMTWKRSSAHSDTKQGMRRAGKIHALYERVFARRVPARGRGWSSLQRDGCNRR